MTKETLFEQIDEIFSDWHGGNLHIGQEREELIKEVLEKAINYNRCCTGLKAVDITDVEGMPDPYWKEYIEGKQ
tara:strand:+ start:568 stop:789 length:222 start_codon:yes stop_codon:yes gene_type:complete